MPLGTRSYKADLKNDVSGTMAQEASRKIYDAKLVSADIPAQELTHRLILGSTRGSTRPHDFNGKSTVNVLPRPGVLSMWMAPPCSSTIQRTIERPRPAPPSARERGLSTR